MTRTVLFILAACIVLVLTMMASILSREIVPAAPFAAKPRNLAELMGPSPNAEGKRDRLAVSTLSRVDEAFDLTQSELRQAFASDSPYVEPGEPIAGPVPMPRARAGGRPAVQKNYTLLSDMQIAAIKGRLRLTSAQEALWPDVENALRAVARSLHDKRLANPAAGAPAIEAESMEVEQLKAAAKPLIAQLREDQKREVRTLARIIGLDAIASQI